MSLDLQEAQKLALEVRAAYSAHNRSHGRPEWSATDYLAGLSGDVGNLAKLVMAADGKRDGGLKRAELEHELSDCLWSILVLCDEFNVDLSQSFPSQMADLLNRVVGEVTP